MKPEGATRFCSKIRNLFFDSGKPLLIVCYGAGGSP